MNADFILLTKFNVGLSTGKYAKRKNEWMEDRIRLFQKYTLPSITGQKFLPEKWYIFIDKCTNPLYHRQLWDIVGNHHFINIVLTDSQNIIKDARDQVNTFRRRDRVVTTRLDNDDALHYLFFHRIKEELRKYNLEVNYDFIVNFDWGIVYNPNTGDARISLQGSNPFISKVERGEVIQTVWGFKHTEAVLKGKYIRIQDKNTPMWVQLVHGNNVSNSMQGSPYFLHQDIFNVEFERYFEENFR